MWFGQTFSSGDLAVIGLLVVLEGILSIDNALVLGLLAKRLPRLQQRKALTYGLVGALAFRLVAVGTAALLMKWRVVKLLGGAYLLYVAGKHLLFETRLSEPIESGDESHGVTGDLALQLKMTASPLASFWPTVLVIELTDIAFAVDSILAAIAMVGASPLPGAGPHPKLWVVLTGGMLGVVLMRFAAAIFIRLLERFPRFELAAYLLVLVIGGKLLLDWGFNAPPAPDRLEFHSPHSLAFWVFWSLMALCFSVGFIPQRNHHASDTTEMFERPQPAAA